MSRRTPTHAFGLAAEEIVIGDYARTGAALLARRWRCREGEIDLVFEAKGEVIFVEVKARRDLESAAQAVSAAQWRRIGNAALAYLTETGRESLPCRFDLATVDGTGRCARIENAAAFDGW